MAIHGCGGAEIGIRRRQGGDFRRRVLNIK
jgi:hypothetical protein